LAVCGSAIAGESAAPLQSPAATASAEPREPDRDWKLETLELKDGTSYAGFVQATRQHEIEFVEILLPPGKPMFAVVRPMEPRLVAKIVRLSAAEHHQLVERFQEFRNRARIEAGRMDAVTLTPEARQGTPCWSYAGDWFALESRADEGLTRRCVVRIEQVFRAYRQLLPPRVQPAAPLRILLFGSMEDYRTYVEQLGLKIETSGFFVPDQNMLVAGSDLEPFARRLAQVRAKNAQVRRQYETLKAGFPKRLEGLMKDLQLRGFNAAEIDQEVKLRTAVWQREYDAEMARLDRLEQQNEASFGDVTRHMFAQLYHEAWHAYVENYVYPQRQGALPRWLNEGLAQIFENGQLEGDALRIDAPDRDRLKRLQAELKRAQPLELIEVLTATESDFLTVRDSAASARRYLYSWGLAYDLTFHRNLLRSQSLDPYVVNQDSYGPAARFTRLTGLPLGKFEQQWRQTMRELHGR
jgi:hypothetical protein